MQKISLAALTLSLGLTACTKDRPFDSVYKVDDQDKQLIMGGGEKGRSAEYLYVSSMGEGARSTEAVFPGEMGDERIVRFRFTKDALIAEGVETDPRFEANPLNGRPVLSIPVTHHAYRCAENAAGECSNKEEENTELQWAEKNYFRPNLEGLSVLEVNTLGSELEKYLAGGECLKELPGARVVDFKIDGDSMLLTLERSYQRQPVCATISEAWELPSLTFSMQQSYSFVKRSKLISKDYQPVNYPDTDKGTFGFFSASQLRLATDYRDLSNGLHTVMERWNPKRKVIKYGLTANFGKPENAGLLKATQESVAAVNAAFRAADVDLRIELEKPSDKEVADIRNSMIVLVEEPMDHGVLGYGPAVADPITGEIISARTVMYGGNLISGIQTSWDDLVENVGIPEETETKPASMPAPAAPIAASTSGLLKKSAALDSIVNAKSLTQKSVSTAGLDGKIKKAMAAVKNLKGDMKVEERMVTALLKDENAEEGMNNLKAYRRSLDTYSKKCLYPADYMNVQGAISLADVQKDLKNVRRVRWAQLSESERSTVIQALMPYLWIPTLVHELGHNMGLRHNFNGSEDAENFYAESEVDARGHGKTPMKYSSIMDYGFSSFNELRIMGKYDVAALRFGYGRSVELSKEVTGGKERQFVEVKSTLADLWQALGSKKALKEYQYCTDENVGSSLGCRRFDEGTTYGEIAKHLLTSYETYYSYRNFRNGRRVFNYGGDIPYYIRTIRRFLELRPFMDVPELIADIIDVPLSEEIWNSHPFLKPYKEGYDAALAVFLSPALTPEVTCFVSSGPQDIRPMLMSELMENELYSSCFDAPVVAKAKEQGLAVLAQAGKSVLNQQFADNPSTDADDIDVRGNWIDKVLGFNLALTRELGSRTADTVRTNYFEESAAAREQIMDMILGYLFNRLAVKTPAKLANGKTTDVEFTTRPNVDLPRIYNRGVRELTLMPDHPVKLGQIMLTNLLVEMWTPEETKISKAVREYFEISEGRSLRADETRDQFVFYAVNGKNFMINRERNAFATLLMELREDVLKVETMEEALVKPVSEEAEKAVIGEFVSTLRKQNPDLSEEDLGKLIQSEIAKPENQQKLFAKFSQLRDQMIGARKQKVLEVAKKRAEKPEDTTVDAELGTDAEKAASKLDPERLSDIIAGKVENSKYLGQLFEVLLQANLSAQSKIWDKTR